MVKFSSKDKNGEDKLERRRRIIKELAPYASLGIQMVLTIGLCGYIGWLIDEKTDSSPVFLIIGTFFGAIAGMVYFIKTVLKKK